MHRLAYLELSRECVELGRTAPAGVGKGAKFRLELANSVVVFFERKLREAHVGVEARIVLGKLAEFLF